MTVLQSALTASNTSTVLRVPQPSKVWIEIEGTYGGGTVSMQESQDGSGFSDFQADGSVITWSADNTLQLELPSGWYRFVAAAVTTVSVSYEILPL